MLRDSSPIGAIANHSPGYKHAAELQERIANNPLTLSVRASDTDTPDSVLEPNLKSMLELGIEDDKEFTKLIRCLSCSHAITDMGSRSHMLGKHAHDFTNPHGFSFHVGCFSQALGCDISGRGEAADSWFMGYVWQVASCAGCTTHLGWYFTAEGERDHQFYGLILNRLQQDA